MIVSADASIKPTVSHMLGEMTWLLSQSPLHAGLKIGDLEWLVMPALLLEQYYVFRDGERPVGLALWAKMDAQGVQKLERGVLQVGNQLTLDDWKAGDQIWLVDLVAPFANSENHQLEIMMADLIMGPLAGKAFSFHQTDPATGNRTIKSVSERAGEELREKVAQSVH